MFYSHNTVSKLSDCYAGTNVAHFLADYEDGLLTL